MAPQTPAPQQQTVRVPAGWNAEACRHWAQGQAMPAIQAVIAELNTQAAKRPALSLQLAYYFFLKNDYLAAAKVLEQQMTVTPEHLETQLNLAVCYSRLHRCEEAVVLAARVLAAQPENFTALDGLTACMQRLGRLEEAARYGTRVLELKDRGADAWPLKDWTLPAVTPAEHVRGKQNVIAFSLWGRQAEYLRGALRNALLAPDLYPGWVCRFYVDASVPASFRKRLADLGAQVIMHPGEHSLRQKLAWRFQVANDPRVGYFLVRDTDSVINLRERLAVEDWLASGRWFHVMRDWWTHTDLILAGMWGGVAGVLPNLSRMLEGYVSRSAETPNIDQWFLRDRVWPYVRTSCRVHDRCFSPAGALPFPGQPGNDRFHVGQNEYVAHGALQQTLIQAWIEADPEALGRLRKPAAKAPDSRPGTPAAEPSRPA